MEARSGNFLTDWLASMDVLNELVHLGDALIVLFESSNLPIKQRMLFIAHLQVLLQAFDIAAESLVLLRQLLVEVILEVQISLHVRDLAIPVVELTALL